MYPRKTFILMLGLLWWQAAISQTNYPTNMEADEATEMPLSVVRLPIQIHKAELERDLNAQLGDILYEDNNVDGNGLSIKAEKAEQILLQFSGKEITYRVPMKLWVKKNIRLTNLEAEGDLFLEFKTEFDILPNWELMTKTSLVHYEWTRKPVLKVVGVDLPIRFIANQVLENSKQVLTEAIDEQVKANLDLGKEMTNAWKMMQDPFLVSEEYQTWMVLRPRKLYMTPMQTIGENLSSTVVLESEPRIYLGPPPSILPAASSLPPFAWEESIDQTSSLLLQTDISFEEAERLAKANMVGMVYQQGKRKVRVEDITLYGKGNKLVVETALSGTYKGNINLVGKPVYNQNKDRLELEDLDVELATKNVLHKSIGWLLKGTFKKQIQENLDYYLNENLAEMKRTIEQGFVDMPVAPGVLLNGQLDDLTINKVFIVTDAIRVWVEMKGALLVDVKGLSN